MAETREDRGVPGYQIGDFAVMDRIANAVDDCSDEEEEQLDPGGRIRYALETRRNLLTRAWRIEATLLAELSGAMVEWLDRTNGLAAVGSNIDHRLIRLMNVGEGLSDLAEKLYTQLKRVYAFATEPRERRGFTRTAFNPPYSLKRFEQLKIAGQPHEQ